MQPKPSGLRHVASHELRAAVHQVGDEGDIAGQSVQAGDNQHCPALAGQIEGGGELGPVGLLPALNLGELARKRALAADIGGDSRALGNSLSCVIVAGVGAGLRRQNSQ